MKLNELKQMINESVLLENKAHTSTIYQPTQTVADRARLAEIKDVIEKLTREGKLEINIKVLSEKINKYFKSLGAITANLTYSQYTDTDDLHPFDDDDKYIENANAVGVLTLVYKEDDKICHRLYEVFDAKARLMGKSADFISHNEQDDTYYIEDFETINILDLVPSYKNTSKASSNTLIRDYPNIVDMYYDALEQSQRQDYAQISRIIEQMIIENGFVRNNNERKNHLTKAMELAKEQAQSGVEY